MTRMAAVGGISVNWRLKTAAIRVICAIRGSDSFFLKAEHFLNRTRIQDPLLLDPASLRGSDAIWEVQEIFVVVGIRADNNVNTHIPSFAAVDVIQIEPVEIRIHFKAGSRAGGFLHDFVEIEIVSVPIAKQTACRMTDDAHIG